MTLPDDKVKAAIALLSSPQSSQRRSGAKQLRKMGDPQAGTALLEALRKELKDTRTWETQYQMIMALGVCNVREALPYLLELRKHSFEATMVYVGIGDALLRLSRQTDNDVEVLLTLIEEGNPMTITGALQAMAMLRMIPSEEAISKIVSHARTAYQNDWNDWSIVWVLRAAPGWKGPAVDEFLQRCARISFQQNQQIHAATQLALAGKYEKWSTA